MIDSIRTRSPSALPVKIHPAKWAHDQWLTFKLTPGSSEDPAPKLRSAIPVEQGEMETVTEVVINCQLAQPPTPFLFTHIKRVAAIIAALSFLFVGLWFGVSTRHAPPQSSYPYYDTQKPVPPWSEPMPLKGNHDKGRE